MTVASGAPFYGLIGHPVGHVRSPAIFNRFLAERGLPGTMIPLDIAPADLPEAVAGLRRMRNLAGFLVTMPHKESISGLVDDLSPVARAASAVNIVRRKENGSLYGDQLDGAGFVAALRGKGVELDGASVFVAGSGGVSAGICSALAQNGSARISIANRSAARAAALIERLGRFYPGCRFETAPVRPDRSFGIVVNATSLGLSETDPLPIDLTEVEPPALVADVIIAPRLTRLLEIARQKGLRVQYGEEMVMTQLPLIAACFDIAD